MQCSLLVTSETKRLHNYAVRLHREVTASRDLIPLFRNLQPGICIAFSNPHGASINRN